MSQPCEICDWKLRTQNTSRRYLCLFCVIWMCQEHTDDHKCGGEEIEETLECMKRDHKEIRLNGGVWYWMIREPNYPSEYLIYKYSKMLSQFIGKEGFLSWSLEPTTEYRKEHSVVMFALQFQINQ